METVILLACSSVLLSGAGVVAADMRQQPRWTLMWWSGLVLFVGNLTTAVWTAVYAVLNLRG